ncbi:hypothetical protein RSA31_14760 [Pantoea dispersa]|nr:hypothetical protein NS215_14685 [Pantoea dispersa]KTS87119.1 hypothetical protein RSA31_14760 [Pantoea dispersa]PPC65047.1 hypothetical protein C1Y43_22905 [Pantoea sp. ICBG 828]
MALSTAVRLADLRDKSRRYATCGLETGHLNGAAIMPLRNLRSGNRAAEWCSHKPLQPVRMNNLPSGRHSNNNTHKP